VVCEKNAARSDAINTPHALLNALPTSTTFIFLSTDQVYDGIAGRYANAAPAQPVNRYGRSKLAFELALHAALPASMSLRSSLILGPRTPGRCRKQSFLQFCEDRARGALQTDFIADEYRSVVWVGDLVQIIRWAALQGGASSHAGVYNMGGPERLTRVDVARGDTALPGALEQALGPDAAAYEPEARVLVTFGSNAMSIYSDQVELVRW
jgi:dTDP-4-dehydrorhamnose reductase